jgi:RNA polymerase sigma factor (sigma-70 family)
MSEDQARETEAEERRITAPLAAALFREHADWLRRYVRRLAGNWSLPLSWLDPDDVVQDAFVQLLRHDWAEPIRSPGAWLCVVVRNQVARAAQQHRRFTDGDPAAHIEEGTAGWSSVSRQASTEEILAARAVVDAIADLAGNQQVATYLSRVQGWPHADIAAFLGCSASAAGVHVHRGTRTVSVVSKNSGVILADSQPSTIVLDRPRHAWLRAWAAVLRPGPVRWLAAILTWLAPWTVIFFISGGSWRAVFKGLVGTILAILAILAMSVVMGLILAVIYWIEDLIDWLGDQRRQRHAERHDRAVRRERDSGS